MGKQTGVIQFKGKLAEVVGMKNGFGTGSDNFIRQYVQDINNPQTNLQLDQRAKMLPAVLFRRQLATLIERAWEGKKFGGPSTREFMKYALKEPWTNVPQLMKDSTLALPGAYLVSRGSLPTIGVTITENTVTTNLATGSAESGTIGEFSTAVLSNNPFLREGDQLTFILCTAPTDSLNYCTYYVRSIYLDSASTEALLSPTDPILIDTTDTNVTYTGQSGQRTLGATVVLSREGTTTAQRSTQRFVIDKSKMAAYFNPTLFFFVADSYRRSESRSSAIDWPYDSDAEGGDTNIVTINVSANPVAGGTVTGGGTFTIGDQVTIQATPAQDYSFDGWKLNGQVVSTQSSYTFTAESSGQYVAEFTNEDRP